MSNSSSATAPTIVDGPNLKVVTVKYISEYRVKLGRSDGTTRIMTLIPKPEHVSSRSLESVMECGKGHDEPHGTFLNMQGRTRYFLNAFTNGMPVHFKETEPY
ncbi:unnamed protein product [Rhizoctonia solani]|uniref:Uncharacterized protein n=1 Tax=Rhizoctonia solani TaxID=456999 RepID=A0A8H3D109_9AGAM|nr:unnamed protein product [Rhizoctonia solani]